MKTAPLANKTLTAPPASNETIATYCPISKCLMFTPEASGQVIKLTGKWQDIISICVNDHQDITLDLEDFDAPHLTHIVGNDTLDIYNWTFEK